MSKALFASGVGGLPPCVRHSGERRNPSGRGLPRSQLDEERAGCRVRLRGPRWRL